MRSLVFTVLCIGLIPGLYAQQKVVYTIPADSVKLTYCDSSELIIENHTQNVPGFLFNTGKGRTIFKRGAQKLNDSLYLIGADTVKTSSHAWQQGGNAFGTTGILGTLDNNHLDLYTNNLQNARLTNTGNLLLGTTTDNGSRLQVNGGGAFNGSLFLSPADYDNAGSKLFLSMNNSDLIGGYGHHMIFQVPAPGDNYYFEFGPGANLGTPAKALILGGNNSGNIIVTSSNNYIDLAPVQNISIDASGLYLTSGGYNNMDGVVVSRNARSTLMTDPLFTVRESVDTTVFQTLKNGNVGVGTNAPTAQFHTTGTVRFAGLTMDTTKTRVLVTDVNGNLFYRDAATVASDPIRTSLAVNGPIRAKTLMLSTKDWPDYVFDSSYALMPLPELKEYIRRNSHLPGIVPAAAAENNGVDVGNTQAALLKKIEELTLYTIKQDQEIEFLKTEMAQLRQLIITKSTNKQ